MLRTKILVILSLFLVFGCEKEGVKTTDDVSGTYQVAINCSSTSDDDLTFSRTAINDENLTSTEWLVDDCIYMWAKSSDNDFTFSAQEFELRSYGSDANTATFVSNLSSEMTEGQYSYYACYPKPTSSSGTTATLNIAASQNGSYDGENDILVAEPITAGALSSSPARDTYLNFKHLTHILRIKIPEGKNYLGSPITKLEIDFPTNVVGDMSVDVSTGVASQTLSNGSSKVTVNLDQPMDAGGDDYIWVFINPTTINGTISFRAYTDDCFVLSKEITTTMSKTMEAGRITPISLSIPGQEHIDYCKINIKTNNLGETINTATLTAPTGAYFTCGESTITLSANSDGDFEFSYIPALYADKFIASGIGASFESENALVTGQSVSVSESYSDQTITISQTIPYLFEEDFYGISETDSYDLLTPYKDLPGLSDYWVDGRVYYYSATKCIALKCYYSMNAETNGFISLKLSGRTYLKSGKTVTLKIAFDSGWRINNCSKMKMTLSSGDYSGSITFTGSSSSSTTNLPEPVSTTVAGCSSTSTIQFKTNGTADNFWQTNYDYVYMDNIKISIN